MFSKNYEKTSFIYLADVSKLNIEKVLSEVPDDRRLKALNLSFNEDKKLSLGAYLLLKKALKLHGFLIENYKMKYEKNGKPNLENFPLNFSLSHSGNYVVVALSKNPIGVDIQKIKEVDEKLIKFTLSENEIAEFNSNKSTISFFKYWTAKEAYLKLTGEGIKKPLNSIDLAELKEHLTYFNKTKDYLICVSHSLENIKKKQVRI